MANRFSSFVRSNFTTIGRQEKKELEARIGRNKELNDFLSINKGLGDILLNEGYRRKGYHEHREINDIFQPRERLTFGTRNRLANDLEILRSVIYKKTTEINRNGINLETMWIKKCMREYIEACVNPIHTYQKNKDNIVDGCSECPEKELPFGQEECGEEFMTNVSRCTECGFPTRAPDRDQKFKIKRIIRKRSNVNNHTFKAILFSLGIDLEKHDNCFLVSQFEYTFANDSKTPNAKSWIQSYRGDPARIRPIIQYRSGDLGSVFYTCIRHRKIFERFDINEAESLAIDWPLCKEPISDNSEIVCGLPLQKVEYVLLKYENERNAPIHSFINGEIQHGRKYSPTTAMGVSLIDSLYYPILQLLGQEKWIAEYYLKMRMFKGFLDIPRGTGQKAKNINLSISSEFQKWTQDNWYIPILSSPVGSQGIKFIRLDDSPKEMEFLENRTETRTQIGSAYGVSNVFLGDSSTGSGLNNQGLEMAVTNREVKHGQNVMDDQILAPWCASILDIYVDQLEYVIRYNTNEEQDLMAVIQRESNTIANYKSLQEMGARVGFNTEGELYAWAPRQGEPLVPGEQPPLPEDPEETKNPNEPKKLGSGNGKEPNDEVPNVNRDGTARDKRTQSLDMEGAPNEPKVQGSGITTKSGNIEARIKRHLEYSRKKKEKTAQNSIREIELHSEALTSITQQKEYLSFEKAYESMSDVDKQQFEKLTDDQKSCVSVKIPKISDENPDMNQRQVVAIAFSMCGASKKKEKTIDQTVMSLDKIAIEKGKPNKMFEMHRENDESGVSGTGHVGTGFIFDDGTVTFRWTGDKASTNIYDSLDNFKEVHIDPHPDNNTELTFYDVEEKPTKEQIEQAEQVEKQQKQRNFDEKKHKRDVGGKFSVSEGGSAGSESEPEGTKKPKRKAKTPKAKMKAPSPPKIDPKGNKASKKVAEYTNVSKMPSQQCKNCKYLIRTKNTPILQCKKVEGFVLDTGWSRYWKSAK